MNDATQRVDVPEARRDTGIGSAMDDADVILASTARALHDRLIVLILRRR
jgi:hypothetical protein